MKRYLLSLLGASTLALTVGTVSPMRATFSARNGRLMNTEIIEENRVDMNEAIQISHINDISGISANVQVECNGEGGVVVVYLTWSPRWRSLR